MVFLVDNQSVDSADLPVGIPIRIVNIVIGNNDLSGYITSSAAYDVAFEAGRRIYPDLMDNVNRITFYQPGPQVGDYSCADAGTLMGILVTALISNISYHDRDDFVVVLAPGERNLHF